MFFSARLKEIIVMAMKITAVLIFCASLLAFPSASSEGARKGLGYCTELLIPSLFPFMVLSSYITRSGAAAAMGRVFSPIMKLLFMLDGSAAPVVIMSFIGGFPIGARGIADMYKSGQLSLSQARRMSLFCVGAGPAFLITAIGTVLLGSGELGVILFASQLFSGLILGIISRFFYPERHEEAGGKKAAPSRSISRRDAFTLSCADASRGMLSLAALVILFQTFIGILEQSGAERLIEEMLELVHLDCSEIILSAVLEVTGACNELAQGSFPLWALSAAIAFGGVCVHLQIWGILSEVKPSKPLFVFFRLLAALLSGLCTYVITLLYTPTKAVFSSFSETAVPDTAAHITGGAALLALSALFLLSGFKPKRVRD